MRLETEVRAARARLQRTAMMETAVRWSLYASLAACGCLIASNIFAWPRAVAAFAAAVPVVAALLAGAHRVDLRQAAAALDRVLGLDERVATALESPRGELGLAAIHDAERALAASDSRKVGRMKWPLEGRFLLPSVALAGLLLVLPDSRAAQAAESGGLGSAVEAELQGLEKSINASKLPSRSARLEEARAILEALRSGDLTVVRDASVAAQKMAVDIRAELAKGGAGLDRAALRELADRMEAAGSGASSELSRRHVAVPNVVPTDIQARMLAAKSSGDPGWGSREKPEAFEFVPSRVGESISPEAAKAVSLKLERKNWDRRYDEVVRRYFSNR